MKETLTAIALAGIINTAAVADGVENSEQPKEPQTPHEETAITSSRGRRMDIAPHIQGTGKRRRAEQAGAVLEIEIP